MGALIEKVVLWQKTTGMPLESIRWQKKEEKAGGFALLCSFFLSFYSFISLFCAHFAVFFCRERCSAPALRSHECLLECIIVGKKKGEHMKDRRMNRNTKRRKERERERERWTLWRIHTERVNSERSREHIGESTGCPSPPPLPIKQTL